MSDIASLKDTIIPKSNQLNAEDLLSAPITIKVTDVRRSTSDDQPVSVHYENDNGRPFKPCKSMRKLIIFAWGDDGREWIGKSMTLYNNPEVKWGGVKVGGIRISHMSHIDRDIAVSLTVTKGKKEPFVVKKLAVSEQQKQQSQPADPSESEVSAARSMLSESANAGMNALVQQWKGTPAAIRAIIGPTGCPDEYKQTAKSADDARIAAQSVYEDNEF